MTIPTANIRMDYAGNGSTFTFPYTYKAFANTDLRVLLTEDATGVPVTQTLTTHYTVSGVGSESGGNVVMVTAPPVGYTLTILATIANTQTTDLVNETRFYQSRIEDRMDKLCRADQVQAEKQSRSMVLPESEAGDPTLTTLPPLAERKGKTQAYDAITGAPVMFSTASTSVSAVMEPVLQSDTLALARAAMGPWNDSLTTATGATEARQFADRAAEVASVFDWGAVGDGVADDTAAIQAAITARSGVGALRIPAGTYLTDPLTIPSNSHLIFERGVTIQAASGYGLTDTLLSLSGASNVVMECNRAQFVMVKADYVSGEQRHCFYLYNCTDVLISDAIAKDSGGDGYYINGATRLTLDRCEADNNRRQGFSIIKATTLRLLHPIAKNTIGTAPQSGIDIEPNSDADDLRDILIDCPLCIDNAGSGIEIYLDDYKTGAPEDVEITINNPVTKSNANYGYRIKNVFLNAGSYGGFIAINNPVSIEDGYEGISIVDKSKDAPVLKISNPTLIDPCLANGAYPNYSGLLISDTSSCVTGEIHIEGLTIKSDHAGMDYGVFVEVGQGVNGLRIGITDIKGSQVQPVRWNNLTYTIAEASDGLIDVSRLRATTPRTSGINVDGDYAGTILTNAGASGTVTFALRHYLPPGNKYRFRVEAAFNLVIDTFDATDKIIGTTVAGATVLSAVVGEACEVEYVGTIGGVRYWRMTVLGKESNWTFA